VEEDRSMVLISMALMNVSVSKSDTAWCQKPLSSVWLQRRAEVGGVLKGLPGEHGRDDAGKMAGMYVWCGRMCVAVSL